MVWEWPNDPPEKYPAPQQQFLGHNAPKEGWGPRGKPDCYYTSRVLDSTARYRMFEKKLRASEETERKNMANAHAELLNVQRTEFFNKSDKRELINRVARKVDLCLASYEIDLNKKRQRLRDLLEQEEEVNVRKVVEMAQSGEAALWEEKKKRLAYLLEKRRKEHEARFSDTPTSKCSHVTGCLYALRAKEAQEIQLYQMREKIAKKMSEKETDMMWHEVAMKEAEALNARMEYEALTQYQRNLECKMHSDRVLEDNKRRREEERERLKQEMLYFRSIWEEDNRREEEAERRRKETRESIARETNQFLRDKEEERRRKAQESKIVDETWEGLARKLKNEGGEKERTKRRMLHEQLLCNQKLVEQAEAYRHMDDNDTTIAEETKKQQENMDKKRCAYQLWSQQTNRDCRTYMVQQIKDREEARAQAKAKQAEEDEYNRQLRSQLDALVAHREREEYEGRRAYPRELQQQIEYKNQLKERETKEMDMRRFGKEEDEKYMEEISKMLCRPHHSDAVHLFTRKCEQLGKLCPCSKGYCGDGKPS